MKKYYMFNKPYGCVTARSDERYPTVMDYFQTVNRQDLSPVGRLDLETEGLLIITNDGKLNERLTNPIYHVKKTYEFIVLGELNKEKIAYLREGILLPQATKATAPAYATIDHYSNYQTVYETLHPDTQQKLSHNLPETVMTYGKITLTEGRKHEVRRLMKSVGCYVVHLKRISMGTLSLDQDLEPGSFRELTIEERNKLVNF